MPFEFPRPVQGQSDHFWRWDEAAAAHVFSFKSEQGFERRWLVPAQWLIDVGMEQFEKTCVELNATCEANADWKAAVEAKLNPPQAPAVIENVDPGAGTDSSEETDNGQGAEGSDQPAQAVSDGEEPASEDDVQENRGQGQLLTDLNE